MRLWNCVIFTLNALLLSTFGQQSATERLPPPSAEVSFCMKSTPESTLRSFWSEADQNCAKDPYKLLDLYESLSVSSASASDKCGKLLQHQLRKSLISTSAIIFEEALISHNVTNVEITRLARRLTQLDLRIAAAVWARTIDEVYYFVDSVQLLAQISSSADVPTQILAALRLQWQHSQQLDVDTQLLIRLVHFWAKLRRTTNYHTVPKQLQQQVVAAVNALPMQLRLLYDNKNAEQVLRLLNVAHWEFLYAPRDNGPDSMRRTPLTWTQHKNETDSDGNLVVELNDAGDVAFANRFGAVLKYLYADEEFRQPYFWIGEGVKASRWWQVQWLGEHYLFRNAQTQELLCATKEYDENRRYVTLKRDDGNDEVQECRWVLVLVR